MFGKIIRNLKIMENILTYNNSYSELFDEFRKETFKDGNTSLDYKKMNPDTLNGKIWIVLNQNKIVSCIALEDDHYTQSAHVGRICRYHILKKYRHGRYGFKMLDYLYSYAQQNYKLVYWTLDEKNISLNKLYQHKKVFYDGLDNSYFFREPFTLLETEKRFVFLVNPKEPNFRQTVYYFKFDKHFTWNPKTNVQWN